MVAGAIGFVVLAILISETNRRTAGPMSDEALGYVVLLLAAPVLLLAFGWWQRVRLTQ